MVRIRKAVVEDAAGISQVCTAAWRDTYADLIPSTTIERILKESYSEKRIRFEILRPSGWEGWWVAEDTDGILGAGGGGITGRGISELYVLYVDPNHQGLGLGTQLLEAISADLIDKGAREQWVSVAKGNARGIGFYEAKGFAPRGEHTAPGTREDEHVVALRYWRKL